MHQTGSPPRAGARQDVPPNSCGEWVNIATPVGAPNRCVEITLPHQDIEVRDPNQRRKIGLCCRFKQALLPAIMHQ